MYEALRGGAGEGAHRGARPARLQPGRRVGPPAHLRPVPLRRLLWLAHGLVSGWAQPGSMAIISQLVRKPSCSTLVIPAYPKLSLLSKLSLIVLDIPTSTRTSSLPVTLFILP